MSPSPYDPWRDAYGTHIPDGCRVEQVGLAKEHGALSTRLGKRGTVLGRRGCRLEVRFEGEQRVVNIRPHLVLVLAEVQQPPLSTEGIIVQLRELPELAVSFFPLPGRGLSWVVHDGRVHLVCAGGLLTRCGQCLPDQSFETPPPGVPCQRCRQIFLELLPPRSKRKSR